MSKSGDTKFAEFDGYSVVATYYRKSAENIMGASRAAIQYSVAFPDGDNEQYDSTIEFEQVMKRFGIKYKKIKWTKNKRQ
jgi:hypothetical protein